MHPNPEDEFCDPEVGPNESIVEDYVEEATKNLVCGADSFDEAILVAKMEEGRFSYVLYRITEPVLFPVRRTIQPLTNAIGVDLSPAAAILLCELLQYLMRLIFRA